MSQTTILHIMFGKEKSYLAMQKPVSATSRRIGVKTARPGVEYSPHKKS